MQMRQYTKGKWQFEFKHEGKRYRKKGFKTKRDAEYAGNKMLSELQKGYDFDSSLTMYEYFEKWCKSFKKEVVSEVTYKSYSSAIDHIGSHPIGRKLIKDISRYHYQEFINDFAEKHAKETVRKINGYIRAAFDDAVYEGLITRNPTYKVTYTAKKPNKSEESKYINLTDYEKLKQYLKTKNSRSSLALYIMICTGCRVSGVLNLKEEFIDEVKNEIFIDEQKTDSSPRYVSVGKEDIKFIKQSIKKLPTSLNNFVFGNLTINAINKRLKIYCNTLGIKSITSHALRHTHCSYLLAKGVSIYYISRRLGHKNISVTTSIYSHLLEETYREEDKKTIDILNAM